MREYVAQVKHRKWCPNKWMLAIPGERVYKTLEDAKQAINTAIELGEPKYIEAYSTAKGFHKHWHDDLEVVASRIKVREVTDWEILEVD